MSLNRLLSRDIRNRTRHLEHAVIGPRAQVHLFDRGPHQVGTLVIEMTEFLRLGRAHVPVDQHALLVDAGKTRGLQFSRHRNPRQDHNW